MVIEREGTCDAFSSVQGLVPDNVEPRKKEEIDSKKREPKENDKVEICVLM